jgi:ArsR family transcriptional regulator
VAANTAPVCACDLGDEFALGQPTVSHHLKVLRDAGLVTSERRGTWGFYQLHPAAAAWVRATLATLR